MGQLEYEAFHEVISQDCPSLSDQTEMKFAGTLTLDFSARKIILSGTPSTGSEAIEVSVRMTHVVHDSSGNLVVTGRLDSRQAGGTLETFEMSEHYSSHCKMVQSFMTEVTYEQAFMQRSDASDSTAYFGGSFLTKSYPREIYEQGD